MQHTQALLIAVLVVLALASFWMTWAVRSPLWRVSSLYSLDNTSKYRSGQGLWSVCGLLWSTDKGGEWTSLCKGLTKDSLERLDAEGKTPRYGELQAARVASALASAFLFVGVVLAIGGVVCHQSTSLHLATAVMVGLAFVAGVTGITTYSLYASKQNVLRVQDSSLFPPKAQVANANNGYGTAYGSAVVGTILAIPAFIMVLVACLKSRKTAHPSQDTTSDATYSPDLGSVQTAPAPLPVSTHASHISK